MRTLLLLAAASLFLLTPASAQDDALARLEASPRHHEWVTVEAGDRGVHAFLAFPERAEGARPVVVIHENRGLTDWVRGFADALAEAGYLAIAPDLLSGFDAEHDRTSDFATSDDARTALYELDPDGVTRALAAVQAYVEALPAAEGGAAVVGFCWGGAQAFRYAADADGLAAAFVFYGSPPAAEAIPRIGAPVYGFYGENDARINATIEATESAMGAAGKTYEPVIYPAVGHAFMRAGDAPDADAATRRARDDAFARLTGLLEGLSD